jgi:superfamily II DNA/RNA helicase
MSDNQPYPNPITGSFRVLEGYRNLLDEALEQHGTILDSETRSRVMKHMEVDRGLIFSKNSNPSKRAEVASLLNELQVDERLIEILDEQFGSSARFYEHQEDALRAILQENGDGAQHTVVATGTGSGKTETFLVPAMHECLTHLEKSEESGVKALLIYPMNALANDQMRRIGKWTQDHDVSYGAYVGSTSREHEISRDEEENLRAHDTHLVTREEMQESPPDILLTNFIMLDYMLTRDAEADIFEQSASTLAYVVLDEVHTYRGTKATHLMHLLRRLESRLEREPVKIATSATLDPGTDGNQQSGPMKGDVQEYLNDFIKPLLGVSDFNYITLDSGSSDEALSDESQGLPETLLNADHLDWLLTTDKERNAQLIEDLTGEKIPAQLLNYKKEEIYDRLATDPFVEAMQQRMDIKAHSFEKLVRLLRKVYALDPEHDAESIVKAYLSVISYLKRYPPSGEEPLLDFRVHLFLRDISGYLKRCLDCDQFHSGSQDLCPECGAPLFFVSRDDMEKCVARISGRQLSYELRPASNETRKSIYVLLSQAEGATDSEESETMFINDLNFQGETTEVTYADRADRGRFRLELLSGVENAKQAKDRAIPLRDPYRDYDYLSRLSRALLDYDGGGNGQSGKLLGFVDSRGRVSRYGTGLQDEFADTFLKSKLAQETEVSRPLPKVAEIVHNWRAENEYERALLEEADLWLARLIGRPASDETNFLSLREGLDLTKLERKILEQVFVEARAIDRGERATAETSPYYAFYTKHPEEPPSETDSINLHKHYAVCRRGVFLEKGGGSNHSNYSGLSLTDDGKRFQDLINEHDAERIQKIVHSLCEKNVLCSRATPDDNEHFYLRPQHVELHPQRLIPRQSDLTEDNSLYSSFPPLRRADSHSSERNATDRKRIENEFSEGNLDVLVATPTLEMGVDIGDLRTILMVGVPPMPSNYAQRAGRAGRDQEDGQALIVTLCSNSSSHDNFHFLDPARMVNGHVTPPGFNPHAVEVAKKHLNAWMVEGHAGDHAQLRGYRNAISDKVEEQLREAKELFGEVRGLDVIAYLNGPFQEALQTALDQAKNKRSVQQALYQNGFFPDYAFRKDQVPLVENEAVAEATDMSETALWDASLSQRTPELAYYKYSPQTTVYVGGQVYQIKNEAPYEEKEVGGESVRSYKCFAAERQERHISPYSTRTKYDRVEVFDDRADGISEWNPGPLSIAHLPKCTIGFRNDGVYEGGGTRSFSEEDGTSFSVGYKFARSALRISIDESVCKDKSVDISLAFALDRALKDKFRLDEDEMRMLVHPERYPPSDDEDANDLRSFRHILLYDHDGNENVPFEKIYETVIDREFLSAVHQGINNCKCKNGCYLCMRSFSTQFHAEALQKSKGLMALDYLRGEGDFLCEPQSPAEEELVPDLVLVVETDGRAFEAKSEQTGERYADTYGDDKGHNTALFNAATKAILQEQDVSMNSLLIESSQRVIVDAINNDCKVKNGKAAFSRLLFVMLRFQAVEAKHI